VGYAEYLGADFDENLIVFKVILLVLVNMLLLATFCVSVSNSPHEIDRKTHIMV
jgi:hypothetical protein